MNKDKFKSLLTIALMISMIVTFYSVSLLGDTYAVTVIGSEHGLNVNLSNDLVPTDNLNPGDSKTSAMTVSMDSSQSSSLPIYMKAEITATTLGLGGGNLDERIEFTLTNDQNDVLYKGPLSGFDEYIQIGSLSGGQSMELTFNIYLPGEATDNDYQAASVTTQWTVMTQAGSGGGGGSGSGSGSGSTGGGTQLPPVDGEEEDEEDEEAISPDSPVQEEVRDSEYQIIVEEEEDIDEEEKDDLVHEEEKEEEVTPVEPIEPEDIEEELEDVEEEVEEKIDDVEEYDGTMPRTGELPPIMFYILGLIILLIGLKIYFGDRKKRAI